MAFRCIQFGLITDNNNISDYNLLFHISIYRYIHIIITNLFKNLTQIKKLKSYYYLNNCIILLSLLCLK